MTRNEIEAWYAGTSDQSGWRKEIRDLALSAIEVQKDALRYRFLRDRRFCADFEYGERKEPVIVISWPANVGVSGNFDADIDAALAKETERG